MHQSLTIQLKTLTPLWTGGVETGQMERVHETGIIGSLRWWYEAIVRGLGGNACDPTHHLCNLSGDNLKQYEQAKRNGKSPADAIKETSVCQVCQLFGATGWRRRFRLLIVDDRTQPAWTPADQTLNIRPPERNRGWFLPPGRLGTLTLRIDGDTDTLDRLAALLLFLERWGSLGAKPQLGYGIFAIERRDEIARQTASWALMGERQPHDGLPDLRLFGFFRYRFQPQKLGWWTQTPGIERVATQVRPLAGGQRTVPVAPALKNEWRFRRWQREWGDERAFFGALQPGRIRSKVAVSWAYPQGNGWEVRGHAWLSSVETKPAWALFCNPEPWQTVLGAPGMLDVHPATPWRLCSPAEMQQFLEATR